MNEPISYLMDSAKEIKKIKTSEGNETWYGVDGGRSCNNETGGQDKGKD